MKTSRKLKFEGVSPKDIDEIAQNIDNLVGDAHHEKGGVTVKVWIES